MAQEMSFAQALTEARQIIVQQSNRIKTDLDKIKALQETVTTQTATLAETDRALRQKTAEVEMTNDQLKAATAKLDEMRVAKEQSEAVCDRQGQRLSQMQDTISNLEKQLADATARADKAAHELEAARGQLPTQEDTEALAALATLLSAKKGAAPAPKPVDEAAAA
jgi:predicted  nucleic acid-binding Zn-ribbon protein